MKRNIQEEINHFYCDVCGLELISNLEGVPVTVSFSYGHDLDGEEYHFCCNEHLLEFIQSEITKQQPKDGRFVFGIPEEKR